MVSKGVFHIRAKGLFGDLPNFQADIFWLVVWNMFLLFHILGIEIPTNKSFPEGLKPPTRIYLFVYTH